MSSSFQKKGKTDKAMGPTGGQIVPESYNGSAPSDTIGGFVDGTSATRMLMSSTARRGGDENSARVDAAPTMAPPTPAPGDRGRAAAVPQAPSRLLEAADAHGSAPVPTGEAAGRSMTRNARMGGVKMMGATRHALPSLPTPMPSFPDAAAPAGSPLPTRASGSMNGTM